MSAAQQSVLSREELYQLVWSTPMRRLAEKFETSDVWLGQLCNKHHVPKPPVGYWRKREAGKSPPVPPLPACPDPNLSRVIIETKPSPPRRSSLAAQFPDIVAAIDAVKRHGEIHVPSELKDPHPLILATVNAMKNPSKSRYGVGEGFVAPDPSHDDPTMRLWCHPLRVDRCLRIMDTLFKTLSVLGHEIEVGHQRREPSMWVDMCGKDALVRITERCTQEPHRPTPEEKARLKKYPYLTLPRMDYKPTGRLRIDAKCLGHFEWNGNWEDTPELALERKLARVIIGMLEIVAKERDFDVRVERNRREDAARKEREEEERRQEEEARRFFESLIAGMESWEQSVRLRRYIAAIECRGREVLGRWDEESALGQWLMRAKAIASDLDAVEGSFVSN